jgi:hypothetical protein
MGACGDPDCKAVHVNVYDEKDELLAGMTFGRKGVLDMKMISDRLHEHKTDQRYLVCAIGWNEETIAEHPSDSEGAMRADVEKFKGRSDVSRVVVRDNNGGSESVLRRGVEY